MQAVLSVKRLSCPLAIALLVGIAVLGLAPSAHASDSGVARASGGRVLARQYVDAEAGAYVRIREGVGIFVPPGVMSRSGFVTIAGVRRGVYDVHIAVPWRGTVAVAMPLRHNSDTILHNVGGLWLTEGARLGERTVWVTQLSWFTTIVSKAVDKVRGDLCLSFSLSEIITIAWPARLAAVLRARWSRGLRHACPRTVPYSWPRRG